MGSSLCRALRESVHLGNLNLASTGRFGWQGSPNFSEFFFRVPPHENMDLPQESVSVVYGINCVRHFPAPDLFLQN